MNKKQLNIPYLIYQEKDILFNIDLLKSCIRKFPLLDIETFFAIKACYHKNVLKTLSSSNIGFEILSIFEYQILEHYNLLKNNLMFNGIGRQISNSRLNLKNFKYKFVIDSIFDLDKLMNNYLGDYLNVGLRIVLNQLKFNNYYDIQNKLGFDPTSKEFLNVLNLFYSKRHQINLDFIHIHCKINEIDSKAYDKIFDNLLPTIHYIENIIGYEISAINIGGGFGNFKGKKAYSFFSYVFKSFYKNFPKKKLYIEPGRYLVNNAGYVYGEVLDVKKSRDIYYVFTNIPTNIFIPIDTSDYRLEKFISSRVVKSKTKVKIVITDCITTPVNNLTRPISVDALPLVGDKIVLNNCGAYTSSMQSPWCLGLIPIYFIDKKNKISTILSQDEITEINKYMFKK